MIIQRRTFLTGTASLLAAPFVSKAKAAEGSVILASWGGGGAKVFRDYFAGPFTQETGIPVTVAEVPDPSAAIAAAQGQPQHNVIVAAAYQAGGLAQRGLLEELSEDELPNIRHVPEQYRVRDDQGRLLGMPLYFTYYGIAYNTTMAKPEDFASWEALADPRWKNQISITRPVFLAPYDMTLYAKIRGGDESNIEPGLPLLEGIAGNAVSLYTSMASLQQQLSLGEAIAAPFYSSQIQMLRKSGQADVDIVLPKEGGLVLSYVFALPKGAPDRAAALRFMNDAIDPKKQTGAATHGYLPLADNVTLPAEVTSQLNLSMAEVRERNWAPNWHAVASKLDERIRLAQQIVEKAGR